MHFNTVYKVATLIMIFLSCNTTNGSSDISLDQAIEQQLNNEHVNNKRTYHTSLKRKRRYLEFPEGTSFQLVYDLIVGVVDYTNYLILGVTVALAWELPSKPPSEIFADLTDRLKDGTLGTSRNDTVVNIKYVDVRRNATKPIKIQKLNFEPIFKPPMHYQFYVNQQPNMYYKIQDNRRLQNFRGYKTKSKPTWRRKDNYYNTPKRHPFTKWTNNENIPNTHTTATKYPWWNIPTRLKNSVVQRPSTRRFDENENINRNGQQTANKPVNTYPGMARSEHRILPIFGKRTISDYKTQRQNKSTLRYRRSGISSGNPTKSDRMHIVHHRSSRHDLYERISKYLDGRGSSGHHCVLRALCETGQKSHEQMPGSFVGEIMRAVFTMPEPVDDANDNTRQIGYKEQRYDTANSLTGNCASRYHLCKDSLWSSHFVA